MSRNHSITHRFTSTLCVLSLSACSLVSQLPGAGPETEAKTSSAADSEGEASKGESSSSAATVTPAGSASNFTPYADHDEGVTQPMQSAHEGQIVFSNTEIPRKEAQDSALISSFSVGKPLYYRAFFPKTAAGLMNAAKLTCAPDEMRRQLMVRKTGAKVGLFTGGETASPPVGAVVNVWNDSRGVFKQEIPTVYNEVRTSTYAVNDDIAPLIPAKPTELSGLELEPVWQLGSVLAKLPVGDSSLDFELYAGCDKGVKGWVGVLLSKGRLNVSFKPGDRTKLGGFYKVGKGDAATSSRLRPLVLKQFAKDEALLDFAATEPKVESMKAKEYTFELVLRASDKSCKHAVGTFTEDYLGGGNYGNGHYFIADDPAPQPVPCD